MIRTLFRSSVPCAPARHSFKPTLESLERRVMLDASGSLAALSAHLNQFFNDAVHRRNVSQDVTNIKQDVSTFLTQVQQLPTAVRVSIDAAAIGLGSSMSVSGLASLIASEGATAPWSVAVAGAGASLAGVAFNDALSSLFSPSVDHTPQPSTPPPSPQPPATPPQDNDPFDHDGDGPADANGTS
jgi:hypothetical protein